MRIIIAGDVYVNENIDYDTNLVKLFHSCDFRIVNLEAPITKNIEKNKILKTGPHLFIPSDVAKNFFEKLKINYVTLANNHIKDFGREGLSDTFEFLNKSNIQYIGAGKNITESKKSVILESKGIKVEIINSTDHEWSLASENDYGCYPFDLIDHIHDFKRIKNESDFALGIFHGGIDYFDLPSPTTVKNFQFLSNYGADIIVSHHSHRVSGYESKSGKLIHYGLGNFVFTKKSKTPGWNNGAILVLEFTKNNFEFEVFYTRYDSGTKKVFLESGEKSQSRKLEVSHLNSVISNNYSLNAAFQKHIESVTDNYLQYFSFANAINSRYLSFIINKLGIHNWFLNTKHIKTQLNLMRSKTHNEISVKVLEEKMKNEK